MLHEQSRQETHFCVSGGYFDFRDVFYGAIHDRANSYGMFEQSIVIDKRQTGLPLSAMANIMNNIGNFPCGESGTGKEAHSQSDQKGLQLSHKSPPYS